MSVTLQGGCCVSGMREGDSIVAGTLRIWNRIGRATGAQAISLRVMEFAPGLSPAIRDDDSDEILYLLDAGSESADADPNEVSTARVSGWINLLIDGQSYKVDPDTGIYLRPGETFAVNNPGPGPVTFISAQCPDPDCPPQFVSHPTELTRTRQPPIVRLV